MSRIFLCHCWGRKLFLKSEEHRSYIICLTRNSSTIPKQWRYSCVKTIKRYELYSSVDTCAVRSYLGWNYLQQLRYLVLAEPYPHDYWNYSTLSEQHFQVSACSNGTVYGEGQALITTKDGESISWKGMGVGKPSTRSLILSGALRIC